jgi:RNA polymerase sigma-70 factor (ECF subfamily)
MCSSEIPEVTDTAPLSLSTGQGEARVALAYNSEVGRPTVDNDSLIARKDQKQITLYKRSKIEDLSNTITAAGAEAGPAGWEDKLGIFLQASEQCRAQLLWQAQRFTNSREEAEDIVQEALFRAFKNLLRFRGESQMGTWLHVIVRNIGREWLRNRKGRAYLPLEHARNGDDEPQMLDYPDPGRNPEQCCECREMENILLTEIDELNSLCKSAIQMCALEEVSQLEAANALGVNVFTIKSRIFRGKRTLKRAICRRTGERISVEPALLQSMG